MIFFQPKLYTKPIVRFGGSMEPIFDLLLDFFSLPSSTTWIFSPTLKLQGFNGWWLLDPQICHVKIHQSFQGSNRHFGSMDLKARLQSLMEGFGLSNKRLKLEMGSSDGFQSQKLRLWQLLFFAFQEGRMDFFHPWKTTCTPNVLYIVSVSSAASTMWAKSRNVNIPHSDCPTISSHFEWTLTKSGHENPRTQHLKHVICVAY